MLTFVLCYFLQLLIKIRRKKNIFGEYKKDIMIWGSKNGYEGDFMNSKLIEKINKPLLTLLTLEPLRMVSNLVNVK